MSAIWRFQDDDWQALLPSGFPSEAELHSLVESSPNVLPLSGDPSLVVLGREVRLGSNSADLIAIESDGRLVVIETKLEKNAEARRAVVAQVLTYAAHLKGMSIRELEDTLRTHLATREAGSIAEAVRRASTSGEVEDSALLRGLSESLASGGFRLVLVLDEAPSELVQLVGYLESISEGIALDLISVSKYTAGAESLLVPQRVDPEYQDLAPAVATGDGPRSSKTRREVDGSEAFERAISDTSADDHSELLKLLAWARGLEDEGLVTLRTIFGDNREILHVWVRGAKAGLASIWNDGGAYISLWRSVFVRLAWDHIAKVEAVLGESIGQGNTFRNPPAELLDAVTEAYGDAAKSQPSWNKRDFYVAFGDGPSRDWDDAREYGFVGAGGKEWHSKSLNQLEPGHRVFAYIPKGSGVGGYVGVGEVVGSAMLAKDFRVRRNGSEVPYLDVAKAEHAAANLDDPALAEYVVPVRWIQTRTREDAVQDSDFFANQNSAVKLTHAYTLKQLTQAFALEDEAPPTP